MTDEYQIDNVTWAEKDGNGNIVVNPDVVNTDRAIMNSGDLETALTNASEGDTIVLSKTTQITVDSTLNITTDDLTIIGGNIKLADGADTDILKVDAQNVHLENVKFDGNRPNNTNQSGDIVLVEPSQANNADGFSCRNVICENSPRHGIHLNAFNELNDCKIQNVFADTCDRDAVSLEGPELYQPTVRTVYAKNSVNRGSVEINDGVTGATVENIYGESHNGSGYVVQIQDHGNANEENVNTEIDGVYGFDCTNAVDTDLSTSLNHKDCTIENVSGRNWSGLRLLDIVNIDNVLISDAKFTSGSVSSGTVVLIENCDNVDINTLTIKNHTTNASGLNVNNCNDVSVENVHLEGNSDAGFNGIFLQITQDQTFSHFNITDCDCLGVGGDDIRIRDDSSSGTLERYIVTHNFADVVDNPADGNSNVEKNITP